MIVVLAALIIIAAAGVTIIRMGKPTRSYDGLWLGLRRCPEWQGRQAFQGLVGSYLPFGAANRWHFEGLDRWAAREADHDDRSN